MFETTNQQNIGCSIFLHLFDPCLKPPTRYIIYIYTITLKSQQKKIGMVPSIFTTTAIPSIYIWSVVEPYPSEKYARQLGWWHSQSMENKIPWFQTTNQTYCPFCIPIPCQTIINPTFTQIFGASCSHISAVPAVPAPVQEGSKMEWPHCHPAPNLEPRATEILGRTNWSYREKLQN